MAHHNNEAVVNLSEGKELKWTSPEAKKLKKMKQGDLNNLIDSQSYADRALCAQAHWFVYSAGSQPLSTFDDPNFKAMLHAMVPNQGSSVEKPPVLNKRQIRHYIEAEYNSFKFCLRKDLKPLVAESKGNKFCQICHDGVTLDNKSKYHVYGLQYTNSKFRCNHVVALAFRKVKESKAKTIAALGKEIVIEITSFKFDDIVGAAVQDGAEKAVAREWGLEVETCDMHDGDKVSASACGWESHKERWTQKRN